MKPKLLIVTSNSMKFKELSSKLSEFFDCEKKTFDESEIQGTQEEILVHKMKSAYAVFKQPVLVDDISLHLEELNGFPGPYIKDFLRCFTPYETGVKFVGTKARAVCMLGIFRGEGDSIVAQGSINGNIVIPKEKDHIDRHFDFFFQADDTDKPMIEFTTEEKNKISHRGKAMDSLIEILKKTN